VFVWIGQLLFWQVIRPQSSDGDKGLLDLHGKPLINHVIDAVKGLVDEIIVVTGSQQCADLYEKVVSSDVKFAVDVCESKGLLVGAINRV
jgi:GTP:adenosylcobinamide-phosphate guanylyltransferase